MGKVKHILITGANGFVGRHLSEELLSSGAKVSQIFRSILSLSHKVEGCYALDLSNRDEVIKVFSELQPDYVIHLAGDKNRSGDVTQLRDQYDQNVLILLNIIDACRALTCFKRLVFLGSCDEYGQCLTPYEETQKEMPTSAYGLSKLIATQILSGLYLGNQFPSVVLRPTVIYGPGQGDEMFLSALIRSLLNGNSFAMTEGEQFRDFIYIDDVVSAIIGAVNADERINGNIINIGAGASCRLRNVAMMSAKLIDPEAGRLIKFGAVPYRSNEIMDYSVVVARAKELLDWSPSTDLRDGVKRVIDQLRATAQFHA